MNLLSRILTGAIITTLGLFLVAVPFIFEMKSGMISWFYGVPLSIIGIFILLNKGEDKIEGRKDKWQR